MCAYVCGKERSADAPAMKSVTTVRVFFSMKCGLCFVHFYLTIFHLGEDGSGICFVVEEFKLH